MPELCDYVHGYITHLNCVQGKHQLLLTEPGSLTMVSVNESGQVEGISARLRLRKVYFKQSNILYPPRFYTQQAIWGLASQTGDTRIMSNIKCPAKFYVLFWLLRNSETNVWSECFTALGSALGFQELEGTQSAPETIGSNIKNNTIIHASQGS